ncbi:MAG: radical SAM family heme chaperone HemW [Syntrophales bacterium]
MGAPDNCGTAGLYIHIPFCRRKCNYCDFYSEISLHQIPHFLKALFGEMELYRQIFSRFDTLYIGGGTPSVLTITDFEGILSRVKGTFSLSPDTEITVEVNPADVDHDYLKSLRQLGVNRLNVGVQSFNEKDLSFLERRHNPSQALLAVEYAQEAGFSNIGLDLIYGIPGQNSRAWLDNLSLAVSLNIAHLSCYQLTVESRTPLGKRYQRGEFTIPDEETEYNLFIETSKTLEDAGYIHYEVSNFAKDISMASKHNQKYWDHTPYLGLGPAAHSFVDNRRWWNHRSVDQYVRDIETGSPPVEAAETMTTEQLQLEALFLGLRTKKGVQLRDFSNQYQCELLSENSKILATLSKAGLVEIRDGYLYPTRTGLAVADSLCLL